MKVIPSFLFRYPNQQQWIIRATNGDEIMNCKTRNEALQTLKTAFRVKIFENSFD